jgi:hypothetical protein
MLSEIVPRFGTVWENIHYVFITSDCFVQIPTLSISLPQVNYPRHSTNALEMIDFAIRSDNAG